MSGGQPPGRGAGTMNLLILAARFFCARIAHKTKHCGDCGILANDVKCVPAFFEARSHLRCSLFEFYTAISSILSTFERLRFAVFEKCTLFEFHTAISSILSTLGS